MSDYAAAPETYAAWRYLELTDELRPFDGERAEMDRRGEELDLLLADLERSPTVEKVEVFMKRDLELQLLTQRSLSRNLERYHCQKICMTDLEARPGAYPCFGTEEEVRRRLEHMRQHHVKLTPMMAEIEEGQRREAENEDLLAVVDSLIAKRHAHEGCESEPIICRG